MWKREGLTITAERTLIQYIMACAMREGVPAQDWQTLARDTVWGGGRRAARARLCAAILFGSAVTPAPPRVLEICAVVEPP